MKHQMALDERTLVTRPLNEVWTFCEFKDADGTVVTHTVQNCERILKENAEFRKNDTWGVSPEFKLVARIPIAQFLEWESLGITEDSKALLQAIELNKELKTTNRRF